MPVKPKHAVEEPKPEKKEVVEEVFIPEEPKWSLDEIILPDDVKNQILDVATYADNAHRVFELWGFKRTHKFSRRIG
ncbi:MAG: AAA family ATPase, partial [Selenomonadaceae bacterium]|nr:AAA family ATPase [Selenomonadaceae bacterium]